MAEHHIRFGTDIISFYDTAYWGLRPNLPDAEWVAAFREDSRGYFERMFDGVRDAGLEGVELAPNPAGWQAALAAFGGTGELRRALASRGLVLTSSYAHGRQLIGNAIEDPAAQSIADDEFRRHSEFLAEMGADTIVTGNLARTRFGNDSPDDTATSKDFAAPVAPEVHERFAEQLNRLGAIVQKNGVRIAVHTDAYSICSREEDITTVMSLTDPSSVQLCLDSGHVALDGGDPIAVLREHLNRIPTMHWKDCTGPYSGHQIRGDQKQRHAEMLTHFRVLGSGLIDWRAWMDILREHHWQGWAMEEIDHSPDPVEELRTGLHFFDDVLAPIYR